MNDMGLGALAFQLMADLLPLKRDMDEAENLIGKSLGGIRGKINQTLGGLAAGLSVAAFAGWIKGAIDAGDEAYNMAQKVGMSTQELTSVQLAFKQAGIGSEGMQSSLVKLSKGLGEGNDALKRYGFSAKDANGEMKSVTEVLYEVSDVFADMPDGIEKTALATELFGKSGADLIPMLNGGSEGLRSMAEMASRLGLVMTDETAKAADEFNDTTELLGLSTQGIARQVMAQLLPTLNSLAGTFLSNVTEGNKLAAVADVIATAMKLLFSVGYIGVEVFNTMGKAIGGTAAALVAVASGEFRQAAKILEESGRDIAGGWKDTSTAVSNAWSGAGGEVVKQAGAVVAAVSGSTTATKEEAAAAKAAAAELEKVTSAYYDQTASIQQKIAGLQAEASGSGKLNEAETARLKLYSEMGDKYRLLTAEQKLKLVQDLDEWDAAIKLSTAAKQRAKDEEELHKWRQQAGDDADKSATALETQLGKMREENDALRYTKEELTKLSAARLDEQIRLAAQTVATDELSGKCNEETEAHKRTLEALTGIREARSDQTYLQAARDSADAWKAVAQEIGTGITDALVSAFESGRDFFDVLWTGIKDTFKNTALRLVIQPVNAAINGMVNAGMNAVGGTLAGAMQGYAANGISGSLLGAMGGSGLSAYGTAAYSYLTTGSAVGTTATNAALIDSAMGTTGYGASSASAAGGAGSNLAAAGYAAAIAAGIYKANSDYNDGHTNSRAIQKQNSIFGGNFGQWSNEGVISSIMSSLGMSDRMSSLLSGSTAVSKIYDLLGIHGGTQHAGSVVGVDAEGKATTQYGDSSRITDNYVGGIDEALRYLGGLTTSVVRDMDSAFGGTGSISALLKFASDSEDPSIGQFSLKRDGQQIGYVGNGTDFAKYGANGTEALDAFTNDIAKATRSALEALDLPEWASEQLQALASDATMADLTVVATKITEFQSALKGLQFDLAPLGGVFTSIASLSSDAMKQLTDFAGGIEAFAAKAAGFVSMYYSSSEQTSIQAASVLRTLSDAGITADQLGSKEDFRALVDSAGVSTETERSQLVALLNVAQAFAPVGDYLKEQGITLGELAAQAPQTAAFQSLQASDSTRTANGVAQLDTSVQTIGEQITGAVETLQSSIEAGLAAIASATQTTRDLLDSWDGGGRMNAAVAP